jgi:hypothetical protein
VKTFLHMIDIYRIKLLADVSHFFGNTVMLELNSGETIKGKVSNVIDDYFLVLSPKGFFSSTNSHLIAMENIVNIYAV